MPVEYQRDHVGQRIDTLMLCAVYQKKLRFNCRQCLHVSILPSEPVWWLFHRRGWNASLGVAVKRFYCSRCLVLLGAKVRDPCLRVTDEKPTADPLRWPDERTWKQLVSRFRS